MNTFIIQSYPRYTFQNLVDQLQNKLNRPEGIPINYLFAGELNVDTEDLDVLEREFKTIKRPIGKVVNLDFNEEHECIYVSYELDSKYKALTHSLNTTINVVKPRVILNTGSSRMQSGIDDILDLIALDLPHTHAVLIGNVGYNLVPKFTRDLFDFSDATNDVGLAGIMDETWTYAISGAYQCLLPADLYRLTGVLKSCSPNTIEIITKHLNDVIPGKTIANQQLHAYYSSKGPRLSFHQFD